MRHMARVTARVAPTYRVFAVVLLVAALLVGNGLAHAGPYTRQGLRGSIAPLVQQAQVVAPTDPGQRLNLSISLQLRNQAALDSLLNAIYDPSSAQYHDYLTPDEFRTIFAPTSDQVQQVVAFMQSQGLTITNVASDNLLIDASGSVAQVQQAFAVQINTYRLGGRTFYANATPPRLPASLSGFITSIGGLDDSVQYQPRYRTIGRGGTGGPQESSLPSTVGAGPSPSLRSGLRLAEFPLSEAKGSRMTLLAPALAPKDLANAYDAISLQNAGFLGDNQTVALFELDGYQPGDVSQYLQAYNLGNPSITNVLVDGAPGTAGQGAVETEMDIELLAAVAPHARQIVYEGPNTTQGLNDTYNRIVTDHTAHIAVASWGICESSSGPGELQTLDTIFKSAAAEGLSFFVASGDAGAYDCGDTNPAVDSPASDPYVTSVGGTSLQMNSGSYSHESIWSNPKSILHGPKGAGSGGGISNTFAQPNWQSGPGVQSQYSNGNRQVPDVSANADPATGDSIYCTVTNAGCPSSGWLTIGGTSAAAPVWTGGMALINQYLQAHGKSLVGTAGPALYQLFRGTQTFPALHDVTEGNNLLYPATPGYDLASGIGSPDFYNIARDLLAGGGGDAVASSLLASGDFESGPGSSWSESSAAGYELISSNNAHSGQYSAYLCGYVGCDDRIWQLFTVPASYTRITVTYWWYADTSQTTRQCPDNFASRLKTSSEGLIHTLQHACNGDATNSWVQESYDVSSDLANYKGKQVMLFFRANNSSNQSQTSDFYIDDVAINVTQ